MSCKNVKKSTCQKWTYVLFGHNYRVASFYTFRVCPYVRTVNRFLTFLHTFFTWNNCLLFVNFGINILRKINFDIICYSIFVYICLIICIFELYFLNFVILVITKNLSIFNTFFWGVDNSPSPYLKILRKILLQALSLTLWWTFYPLLNPT